MREIRSDAGEIARRGSEGDLFEIPDEVHLFQPHQRNPRRRACDERERRIERRILSICIAKKRPDEQTEDVQKQNGKVPEGWSGEGIGFEWW